MPIKDYPFQSFELGGPRRPILPVKIINPYTKKSIVSLGLIDTGSEECAVPAYLAKALGHNYKKGTAKDFISASGTGTAYSHTTKIEIIIPGKKKVIIPATTIDFIEGLPNILLGESGFLERYKLIIDYPRLLLSIKDTGKYIPPYTTP